MYTVMESAGSVEVCVNLTHPPHDIFEERVTVLVFHSDSSIYIPPNPALASEHFNSYFTVNTSLLPAPDPPLGIFHGHDMIPGSDYEEETQFASTIRNTFIEELRREICYDQVVYDDERLELTETAGLELVPDDPDTVVEVEPFYGDSIFFIIDDDGMLQYYNMVPLFQEYNTDCLSACLNDSNLHDQFTSTEAVVGLERINLTVSEDMGVVELCVRVFEPDIECPIEFLFDIVLSTADRTAGRYYLSTHINSGTFSTVSPMDYSGFSMTLTFDTCELRRCVNVNIVDDLVDEPDEVFDYILAPPPAGLDPRIAITPDVGEIVITGNDCKHLVHTDLQHYLAQHSVITQCIIDLLKYKANGTLIAITFSCEKDEDSHYINLQHLPGLAMQYNITNNTAL